MVASSLQQEEFQLELQLIVEPLGCETSVSVSRRHIWLNIVTYMSAKRDGRSGNFVISLTAALVTLYLNHFMSTIRSCDCMLKDWILSLSVFSRPIYSPCR